MSAPEYIISLLDLVWIPFTILDNPVFLLPTGCAFFVFCLAVVRRLMRVMW